MTDLFTWQPSAPNYRPTDPKTSRDAGRAAHSFTADHHRSIIDAMARIGKPLAAEEVADLTTLDKVQVCKRFAEMERKSLIERTTDRYLNRSGRHAFRYRIKGEV